MGDGTNHCCGRVATECKANPTDRCAGSFIQRLMRLAPLDHGAFAGPSVGGQEVVDQAVADVEARISAAVAEERAQCAKVIQDECEEWTVEHQKRPDSFTIRLACHLERLATKLRTRGSQKREPS